MHRPIHRPDRLDDTIVVDPEAGYRVWAPTYDAMMTRSVDGPLLERFLPRLPLAIRLFDIGCGTGRLLSWLQEHTTVSHAVGLDPSADMLALAADKQIYDTLHQGTGFTATGHYNLAASALATCHMPDLDHFYALATHQLEPGGLVMVIDMHPLVFHLGKGTLVPLAGQRYYIHNHVHEISDHVDTASRAGLQVLDIGESIAGPEWAAKSDNYHSLAGKPLGMGLLFSRTR